MKNKTIVIIVIGLVAVVAAVAVLFFLLRKQPVTQTPPTQTSSTGTGGVSTGASPDLATVGSGVVVVDTPKSDPTQPDSTTAPRVESPVKTTSGNGVALQPASGSSQPATTTTAGNQVSYNYNQSDNNFLNAYYPDAQQVITGNEGPNGNIGQDPANQVLYVTPPPAVSGPELTLPQGSDTSSISTTSDNSPGAVNAYLKALAAATAPFDVVNDSSLVTAPLQDLSPSEAASSGQQASTVLQAISALKTPSSLVDLQASYLDAYELYISFAGQLSSLLNSGDAGIASASGSLETTIQTISTVLTDASTNYKNTAAYYNQ